MTDNDKRRRSALLGAMSYVIWGLLPLYWRMLDHVDPVVILCNRILWAAVFSVGLLAATKRLSNIPMVFRDWGKMKRLIPAALFVTINWGMYIWGVNTEHVLDCSLGYYMNPLISFGLGILLFRERCSGLELAAVALAVVGILIPTIAFGKFPTFAIVLALTFALYGALKKDVTDVDAVTGIAVETLLVAPFALGYLIFSQPGVATLQALDVKTMILFILAGPATATPLMLFSKGVSDLPLSTMGFLQYVSPTLNTIIGTLLFHEAFTPERAWMFSLILAALVLYSVALVRKERRLGGNRP